MTDQTIPVGYVRRAHGVRGDVVVRGLVTDARHRLATGSTLTVEGDPSPTYVVVADRDHQGDVLVHLEGVDDRSSAESLVGTQFVINRSDRRTLEPDEWWAEDLIGCLVVDVRGDEVGTVTDVVAGAAQDRLTVETNDGVRGDVPLVDELVPEIDTTRQRIVVDLPSGLFE